MCACFIFPLFQLQCTRLDGKAPCYSCCMSILGVIYLFLLLQFKFHYMLQIGVYTFDPHGMCGTTRYDVYILTV